MTRSLLAKSCAKWKSSCSRRSAASALARPSASSGRYGNAIFLRQRAQRKAVSELGEPLTSKASEGALSSDGSPTFEGSSSRGRLPVVGLLEPAIFELLLLPGFVLLLLSLALLLPGLALLLPGPAVMLPSFALLLLTGLPPLAGLAFAKKPEMLCCPASELPMPVNASCTDDTLSAVVALPTRSAQSLSANRAM